MKCHWSMTNKARAGSILIWSIGFIMSWLFFIGLPSMSAGAAAIDYLFVYNGLHHETDLNGIGETFIAPDNLLMNASLLLVAPPGGVVSSWGDAHLEIRRGEPGNFFGGDGNVVFRSQQIDFSALPYLGTTSFAGYSMYELALNQWGLNGTLTLDQGQLYSLILINYGSLGFLNHAEWQGQGGYPDGGLVGHNVAYGNDYWAGPYQNINLAFRIEAIPEPSTSLLWFALFGLALKRRSRITEMWIGR
jgi:hypothetical protein